MELKLTANLTEVFSIEASGKRANSVSKTVSTKLPIDEKAPYDLGQFRKHQKLFLLLQQTLLIVPESRKTIARRDGNGFLTNVTYSPTDVSQTFFLNHTYVAAFVK